MHQQIEINPKNPIQTNCFDNLTVLFFIATVVNGV
jgi:hypothetical protein